MKHLKAQLRRKLLVLTLQAGLLCLRLADRLELESPRLQRFGQSAAQLIRVRTRKLNNVVMEFIKRNF